MLFFYMRNHPISIRITEIQSTSVMTENRRYTVCWNKIRQALKYNTIFTVSFCSKIPVFFQRQ